MENFRSHLPIINNLADESIGFIWRLQTDEGDATAIRPLANNQAIINLSVWDSIQDYENFVYKGLHAEILRKRRNWFLHTSPPHSALWWIDDSASPTVNEGLKKLRQIREIRSSRSAFTLRSAFGRTK